jgi:dipeptidyl aminopeptidase/acylaminoacyl peptidase
MTGIVSIRTALVAALILLGAAATAAPQHPLTVDDVLDIVAIDRATFSPDGEWVAAVVQRPARTGEVFGRAAYETDPSRSDVWLVSRRTGERRNLTNGGSRAAGYWCATRSPDGTKLAMLSTSPEGREPRGGDNVRLYVWDRASGALTRMSDAAVMTQTRYGSPLYTLDVRDGGTPRNCTTSQENAPFAWIDDNRLLAVMLPDGKTSGLLDEYGRPFDHAAATRRMLHDGSAPTVSAMGSGAAATRMDPQANRAILRAIDVRTRAVRTITEVPAYPFQGALTVSISPDSRRLALLATTGMIAPGRGQRIPYADEVWQVEKRLGFVDLAPDARVRWAALSPDARYPLELLDWSPDAERVAFRARAGFEGKETALFVATADRATIRRVGAPLSVGDVDAGPYPHDAAALWINDRRLLVRGREATSQRLDWWLVSDKSAPRNLSRDLSAVPDTFSRLRDGRILGVAGGALVTFDPAAMRITTAAPSAALANARVIAAGDAALPLAQSRSAEGMALLRLDTAAVLTVPNPAELLDVDDRGLLWRDATRGGLYLRDTAFAGGASKDLMTLDTHLAAVDWGRIQMIEYKATDGSAQTGAAILPPGYREGRRYPVIVWVYGGYTVFGPQDFSLNPYMPGIYNLQLYAARGYVVLIPSMPIKRGAAAGGMIGSLPDGVSPAIDRLVALGIADAARVGVMGQSFGGYSVYGLIGQSNRFKAAVALAGLTDLAQSHSQFDPAARGYPGIEHQKSANWTLSEVGPLGLGAPPEEDHDRYWRNSPIAYVDRVQTPLLLIHGEYDKRGAPTQADTFFFSLYRQGKTARLLRYWGETHSLAQSPANVRDIVRETVAWFDRYLTAPPAEKPRD